MEAPPPFLVILFLTPQLLGLCLHPSDAMTLLLHYWLVSSGDPSFFEDFFHFAGFFLLSSLDVRVGNQQTEIVLKKN
jgi:hypothetical protein